MLEFFYCINKKVSEEEPVKIVYCNLLEAFDSLLQYAVKKTKINSTGAGILLSAAGMCCIFRKWQECRKPSQWIKLTYSKKLSMRDWTSNLGSMLLSDLCAKPLKLLSVTDAFRYLEKTLEKHEGI